MCTVTVLYATVETCKLLYPYLERKINHGKKISKEEENNKDLR